MDYLSTIRRPIAVELNDFSELFNKCLSEGEGLLVVPEGRVSEFRSLLVAHYEGTGTDDLTAFMKESCWRRLE